MAIWKMRVGISSPYITGLGVNTFHLRTTGTQEGLPDPVALNSLSGHLETFYTALNPVLGGSAIFSFDGQFVTVDSDDPEGVEGDPWTVTMAQAVEVAPKATALVVGWKTASPTRSGRGRTFLSPIRLSQLQGNGTPMAAALTVVRDAASALVDASTGFGTGAFGVLSTQTKGVPHAPLLRDFTGSAVRNSFAVLRSRRD